MFSEDSVALIDADSIYFRTCCVTKKKNEIRKAIKHTMDKIRRECMTDNLLVAVKGQGNFRQDIYPAYKKNRKELDDDLRAALSYGHEYMCDYYGAVRADGMEADDLVSIWANEAEEQDRPYVVVGIDKDLLQIKGDHYNFVKSTHVSISHDAGDYNLMLQCLTGDSTDNIPGIKGIGPKKASKILAGVPMLRRWARVRAAWRGHGAGDPKTSRRLLEMLTSWREYDELRAEIESKTAECKQDVLAGKESKD